MEFPTLATPVPGKFIQIINDNYAYGGSHWFVISNIFSKKNHEVIIYDSYYDSEAGHITDSTRGILNRLYANFPSYEIIYAHREQHQGDTTSCGRWAIAYAYDLALGHNPAASRYDR